MLPLSDDVNDRTLTGDMAEHRMRTRFNLRVGDRTTSTFLITKIGYMYIRLILNINICSNKHKMGKDHKIMHVIDEKICESTEGLTEADPAI